MPYYTDQIPNLNYAKTVIIGNGVTRIGYSAFWGIDIDKIVIPETVTSIGEYALSECDSLTSIEFPSSLTSIEQYAFDGNSYCLLYDFRKAQSIPSMGSQDTAFTNISQDAKIVVPAALYSSWITTGLWSWHEN